MYLPYPLWISANRHPTVPPPPKIDGFVVQTYALYFAQTILLGRLKATRRWLVPKWVWVTDT